MADAQKTIAAIVEAQTFLTQEVMDAKAENATLQVVCSLLLAELARAHPSPDQKLSELTARLSETISTIAAGGNIPHMNTTIEKVVELAGQWEP